MRHRPRFLRVRELMQRNELKASDVDQLIFGMTVMIPEAPFIAREVALQLGLDAVDAYSITRACATSFQTVASAAESILAGNAEVVIAGGTDSTSSVRLPMSPKFSATLRDVNFAKSVGDRLKLLATLRPRDILPQDPTITEFSVGETMGQSTEKMVKKWGVTSSMSMAAVSPSGIRSGLPALASSRRHCMNCNDAAAAQP